MDKVEIRKVKNGDESVLAHIQTQSWKAAFGAILAPEVLKQCTEITANEEMYQNVIENEQATGSILFVNGKPHCIAFWGEYREQNLSEINSTALNSPGLNLPEISRAKCAELICIHSLSDKWHKGFGSMMMEHILAEIRDAQYEEVVLWVFEQNSRARKFYEKHGFTRTEKRKNSFGAVEVMYAKTLIPH